MAQPFGAQSSIKKRSVVIGGRKTSVSLENEFWEEVKNVARARGQGIANYVASVVEGYQGHNVSSALRLSVLEHYQGKADSPLGEKSNRPEQRTDMP